MIHYVRVAVALSRPPKIDEWRRYCVVAPNRQEAVLVAQQMAACTSVMPVESQWESSHRAGPVEPFGVMGCRCWHVTWDDEIADGEEGWMMEPDCPHHSEDTAAWAALDGVDHGIRSAECEAGTCDCDGFIPPTYDRLMEVQGVMGSIAGDPPTPETANAEGPDTDDTPGSIDGQPVEWGDGFRYATGAIVPDELKRRVDIVKVSSCTCEQVNVSTMFDKPDSVYIRGRTDGDCPAHGDLAQIRAFGAINPGDRLRVNTFGVWSIARYDDALGRVTCPRCDDWWHSYSDNAGLTGALDAMRVHQAATTEDGAPECSPPSPRTLWQRITSRRSK